MHVVSALALLVVGAVVSADRLMNEFTGLCLDAPYGLQNYAKLTMQDCCNLVSGDWEISERQGKYRIRNVNGPANRCVDYNAGIHSENPFIYDCNDSVHQWFVPDEEAREGKLSFVTSYEVGSNGYRELSGSDSNSKPYDLADFKRHALRSRGRNPSSVHPGGFNFEWSRLSSLSRSLYEW